MNETEQRIYDALAARPLSVKELEIELGLSGPNIRKALRSLRAAGLAEQEGGRGKPTTYRRHAS
ncbi:helix-turn-helix domain-containing protein [Nocardia rhizosphaerae]|uniref:Helix-turn-helix domain-containing protein n=1 Tax=Nocardia rhizosphaerae TaxID=1691571 RepID=A0ABV8LAG6_9NOCA